jgi:hypothetical protein
VSNGYLRSRRSHHDASSQLDRARDNGTVSLWQVVRKVRNFPSPSRQHRTNPGTVPRKTRPMMAGAQGFDDRILPGRKPFPRRGGCTTESGSCVRQTLTHVSIGGDVGTGETAQGLAGSWEASSRLDAAGPRSTRKSAPFELSINSTFEADTDERTLGDLLGSLSLFSRSSATLPSRTLLTGDRVSRPARGPIWDCGTVTLALGTWNY